MNTLFVNSTPAQVTQSKRTQTNVHERGVFANGARPHRGPPHIARCAHQSLVGRVLGVDHGVAEVVVCQVVVVRTHERHEHTFHVQDHEHLELVAGVNDERSHTVQCSPTPREHLSQQLLTCMNTSLSSCSHCTDTGTPTPLCMSPYRPLP